MTATTVVEDAKRELLEVSARLAVIDEEQPKLLDRRAELIEILIEGGTTRADVARLLDVSPMVVNFALDRLAKRRGSKKKK